MDINLGVEIQTTPAKLFAALTTDTGIAAWWTKAKTSASVGAINEFAFGTDVVTFRTETLEPGKAVGWAAAQVPADWKSTKVLFDISQDKSGTVVLRFSHRGFETMTPMVAFTGYAWAQYLRSLKLYLETGTGEPSGSPASIAAGTTPRR
jgi:uncharacterized protein YndB with AHSA1/START domain